MSLTLRKLQVYGRSKFRGSIKSVAEISQVTFRVLPWDLDENIHMNNSTYLQYMEAGRWDLMFRAGFAKLVMKKKWIAPIGSIRIQYLKPLKPFQRFSVRTQIAGWDEKWIYLEQIIHSAGKIAVTAHVKSTVKSKEGTVRPEDIFRELGLEFPVRLFPDVFRDWQKLDQDFLARARLE